MKKFNLFKEIIVVNKPSLLGAINASKSYAIDINGEIKYEPFKENDILIYQGKHIPSSASALTPSSKPSLETILGKNYHVVEDNDRVLIKAFSNWQEIIKLNTPRASYDDTTGDGVAEFSNKELEDIGWHATEFNINYRALIELLEERCEGTLICIEQEEPYQFSGLGFLSDIAHAKEVLYEYCQNQIKKLMAEDEDYKRENLTDDELEAAVFFKII
ncbi:MAG: hypothetical protein NTW78_11310 [Campylobacterales bacterium]|nr:hypothetical protein [Campylobacterales bacterium]